MAKAQAAITSASSAEYFSKNLQQVGFSSYTKAALTTIKEAVDNSLDACEEAGILPEVSVIVEKLGEGTAKNADQIKITVEDNGPGLPPDDIVRVFGEYLASSKFGRGRCSRGQQGIGISACTTWAQLTNARGATVITKTDKMRQAIKCIVEVDIKHNRGVLKDKESISWEKPHGLACEFILDARIQLNGEGGILAYLNGITLVNPHMTLRYKILDQDWVEVPRVTEELTEIPEATEPHPHTMKLGEFIAHSHLFGRVQVHSWLKKGFSRVHESVLKELTQNGVSKGLLGKSVDALSEEEFKKLFTTLSNLKLMAPSTKSVLSIGESGLAKSIQRVGQVDFFSVVSRKPAICDFKPVLVEVAVARLLDKNLSEDDSVTLLRFANRVPLQFDKSACAMTQAAESVNWRSYGLNQPKGSLPLGPYIIAISVVSPFIKFKNASKETVDASDELVEEIRRALIQAGQKLSKHIRREEKELDLEKKRQHIEQFGPILVDGACRIVKAAKGRREKALEGLAKILGREAHLAEKELKEAIVHSEKALKELTEMTGILPEGAAKTANAENETEDILEKGQLSLDGIVEEEEVKKRKKK
ncbi:MAG TPA: DNA topoisomerase VI subunit B [Deltaproteobacteria bacterium]|nr:MAG: DNA topoisomerase VI subunit B [Deltaproteobacteria bacterium GWA2_45_12]HBF14015.1 DNA topoisomerase VI subunit B [Deltaproteobacteria bacterium]